MSDLRAMYDVGAAPVPSQLTKRSECRSLGGARAQHRIRPEGSVRPRAGAIAALGSVIRPRRCAIVCTLLVVRFIASAAPVPADLAAFFYPPPSATEASDSRRSPLIRDDGSRITTAAEWSREGIAIRQRWFEIMGPWPELLAAPKMEVVRSERRENLEQQFVQLEFAPGYMQQAILLVPPGSGPFPAVVVPYYNAGTGAGLRGPELRDYGYQLAKRGFVALCIGAPGGRAVNRAPAGAKWWVQGAADRPDGFGDVINLDPALVGAKCQPLSFLAYVAANAHTALTRLPNVDAARIGIVSQSYGGKWALFASCLYDKFACAAWGDSGIVWDESKPTGVNYQEPWYLGFDRNVIRPRGLVSATAPRTGAYKILVERGHDLHELHALMAPRPFLVHGGDYDGPARWPALTHAIAVNRLLGAENRVAMHNRLTHAPTPESNAVVYRFFEHFLGAAAVP